MRLEQKTCIPCQGGTPPMEAAAAEAMMMHIPGWELVEHTHKLRRTFTFNNFMLAQDFAYKVGALAESENHHPDISYGWGYCSVVLFTHKIGGLHENDFIMAAKINELKSN